MSSRGTIDFLAHTLHKAQQKQPPSGLCVGCKQEDAITYVRRLETAERRNPYVLPLCEDCANTRIDTGDWEEEE